MVDDQIALHYHLVSKCVRGSFLCGKDKRTRKNYNHRKKWIIDRMRHLAQFFAIEVEAYAIMSNHFHLVVYYDPKAAYTWSNEQVVERWHTAFPCKNRKGEVDHTRNARERDRALRSPDKINHFRRTLGSLSMFMKHLKQPIALRANKEDNCTGHFFDQRFYSGALLNEKAVLAAMSYVDLNPVRSKICQNIEQSSNTSCAERLQLLQHNKRRLKQYISPIVSGLGNDNFLPHITNESYLSLLKSTVRKNKIAIEGTSGSNWQFAIRSIGQRQRAYGSQSDLTVWASRRNFSLREKPLPI